MIKLSALFLLQLFVLQVFSQDNCLQTFHFNGRFAYEQSEELWSSDDMIFRKPALFQLNENKIQKNAIFIFETTVGKLNINCYGQNEVEKINSAANFFNENLSRRLDSISTKTNQFQYKNYKIYNLCFKALDLGYKEHRLLINKKYKMKKMRTYLIYDLKKISKISE